MKRKAVAPLKRPTAAITSGVTKQTGDTKRSKAVKSGLPKSFDNNSLKVDSTVTLQRFPMEKLNTDIDGKRILIVGMSGSGKSTVALDIMRFNKHVPVWVIVSPTEAVNHTYGSHIHPGCIQDHLDIDMLNAFKKRQESRCKKWQVNGQKNVYYRDPSAAIILDDVAISAKLFKDEFFRWAYFNSRHNKTLWVQLTQYFMLVPIDHRRNLSHLFLFRQNSPKEMKKIFDEFAGVFDKFADFRKALELCTADYKCMHSVIDCLNPSVRIEDRIFWYNAPKEQCEFKAGAKWWWAQMSRIYNEKWEDDEESEIVKPTKSTKTKTGMDIRLDDSEPMEADG